MKVTNRPETAKRMYTYTYEGNQYRVKLRNPYHTYTYPYADMYVSVVGSQPGMYWADVSEGFIVCKNGNKRVQYRYSVYDDDQYASWKDYIDDVIWYTCEKLHYLNLETEY